MNNRFTRWAIDYVRHGVTCPWCRTMWLSYFAAVAFFWWRDTGYVGL